MGGTKPSGDLDLTGKVIGEYRVLSKIAEGGFGCTYKAENVTVGEPVCIKHCHNLDRFDEEILIEEAKIMWNLRHFSVPAIRGMLRTPDKKLAMVMSYIPGPTLVQVVEKLSEKGEKLDPEHVAWITERVLNGYNPAYSELYILRGKIYEKQGDLELARQEFEKAVFYNKNLKSAEESLTPMLSSDPQG